MASTKPHAAPAGERIDSAAGRIAARLDGAILNTVAPAAQWRLTLVELRPLRPRTGWLHLAVALCSPAGTPSQTPLATGIVSAGGRGVSPWFELRLYPQVTMADGTAFDARAYGLEAALVSLLGSLIPAGGHLMVEYESPGQNATHAALLLRVPPAATYLGFLMYQAGLRGEFKDWYISEGGHEGPRKLQGNKSPTPEAARAANRANRAELAAFLRRPLPAAPADAATIGPCRERARTILKSLPRGSG